MSKITSFLNGFDTKLNSILNPKILRTIFVVIEIVILFISFLFCCVGLGLIVPLQNWEHGFRQWFDFYIAEFIFAFIFVVGFIIVIILTFLSEKVGNYLSFGIHLFGLVMFVILALLGAILYSEGDRNSSFNNLGFFKNEYEIRIMTDKTEREKAIAKWSIELANAIIDLVKLADTFKCKIPASYFERYLLGNVKQVEFENIEKRLNLKQQRDKYEGETFECLNDFENTHTAFIIICDVFNWLMIFFVAFGTLEGLAKLVSNGDSSEKPVEKQKEEPAEKQADQ